MKKLYPEYSEAILNKDLHNTRNIYNTAETLKA